MAFPFSKCFPLITYANPSTKQEEKIKRTKKPRRIDINRRKIDYKETKTVSAVAANVTVTAI